MAGRNFLFVPGPTNVPDRVLRAMHVADGGPSLLVLPFARDSGPRGSEEGLQDHLRSGIHLSRQRDRCVGGFALQHPFAGRPGPRRAVRHVQPSLDRHGAAARAQVDVLDAEWGEGAPVERYQEALAADKQHQIKAVLFTHNETATGVTSDVGAMRKALNDTRHPALLMVDGVSSIASIDFRMDEWGVDLAVTAPRRVSCCRRGSASCAPARRRCALYEQAKLPRVFFDFGDMRKANATRLLPVHAVALDALRPARVARHAARGRARERLRAPSPAGRRHPPGGEGVGLELCARGPKWNSDTVSADHGSGRASTPPR